MMQSFANTRFFLLVAILFISMSAAAVPQGPVIGKVSLVLGDVTGVDQDGDTFEVVRGADLYAGYTFQTGNRSFVRAEMNDGTQMTLSQNGSASLDSFSFDSATNQGGFNATVQRGGFRYESGLLGQSGTSREHSLISTPAGVIGVRGTIINAVIDASGRMTLSIPQGSVQVRYTDSSGAVQTVSLSQANLETATISTDGTVSTTPGVSPEVTTAIQLIVNMVQEAQESTTGTDSTGQATVQDDDEGDDNNNNNENDSTTGTPTTGDTTTGTNTDGGSGGGATVVVGQDDADGVISL